jgi:putative DNA primase/helicase
MLTWDENVKPCAPRVGDSGSGAFAPRSEDEVREVLARIDPNCDRDRWKDVAAGVNDELGKAGFDLFDEWSSRADNYNATAARSTYRSFKPGGGIGFGTVVNFAKEEGYVPNKGNYKKPTPAELADRAAKAEARRKVHEAEEAKEAAEAKARAEKRWADAAGRPATPEHPYLKKKGIQPHGLRVGKWAKRVEGIDGPLWLDNVLYVPMFDPAGNIHSLQGITVEGDKLFLSGGAKKGHFYPIGKPHLNGGEPILIYGEGLATSASVHESLGHATFCCFDLGNMIEVVRRARAENPKAHIVIAADNDTKTKGNPGLTKATALAIEVGARLAVPPPGDFNDLFVAEGPEAVLAAFKASKVPTEPFVASGAARAALAAPSVEAKAATAANKVALSVGMRAPMSDHFEVMGFDKDEYFIYDRAKKQVLRRTSRNLGKAGLLELAPLQDWEMNFPPTSPGSGRFDDLMATRHIYDLAHAKGVYNPAMLRGRGAWIDGGRMVYHCGDRLFVDGRPTDLGKLESRYLYERGLSLPAPTADPLSDEDGQRIARLVNRFGFSKPDAGKLLAGWIFLAPVAGALRWRPHVWVFGPAGSGKTTLLENFVAMLLGENKVFSQGDSTEAGLRQTLKSDALPLMIDESEANEDEARARVQKTLVMLRQASSRSEAKTLRGTVNGQAQAFHIQSMALLGSIAVAISEKADNDRFCRLELKGGNGSAVARDEWAVTVQMLADLRADRPMPQRLLARGIALFSVLERNVELFIRAATAKFGSPRHGDQYGTLLAGWWTLQHSAPATAGDAERVLAQFNWADELGEHAESDGEKCIRLLCNAQIRGGGGESYPVRTLLARVVGQSVVGVSLTSDEARRLLNDNGINTTGDRQVAFANQHAGLKLLAGAKFGVDLRSYLLQVEGATRLDARRFGPGPKQRAIGIPFRAVGLERDEGPEAGPL